MVESSIKASARNAIVVDRLTLSGALRVVRMLAKREWLRFFRQRSRVLGALGQPLVFWILFGTGMHSAFRGGEQDFMEYFLPGTLVLVLMFTAIFTTISIIEDRREGFLQGVLVAPVPRWTMVAGKVLGGAAIAWVQGVIFLAFALAIGHIAWGVGLLAVLLLTVIAALSLTALGFIFAWRMDSTQGFHAIMNLVLMPLWLLSGAFFPIPALAPDSSLGQVVIHWTMRVNPLSYLVSGLRIALAGPNDSILHWLPGLTASWVVSVLFLMFTCLVSWRMVMVSRETIS